MKNYQDHIIPEAANARQALQRLDSMSYGEDRTLFVISQEAKLMGSITDGDIRRGLLKDREITDCVSTYMNKEVKFLTEKEINPELLKEYRRLDIRLLPIVNMKLEIVRILDMKDIKTIIPASVIIMAGGRGERLRPLTDSVPKPLLKVGDKPILEHNIDRLIFYGITDFYISVRYLSEQIKEYFGNGESKNISITYIEEEQPLGTIGALGLIEELPHEHILLMNSDILTNIDFEDFFTSYVQHEAEMCMASVPYVVKVPYGVLELKDNHHITALKEKPTYTYYSNAGIYFLQKNVCEHIPKNEFFNATDLMTHLIALKKKIVHYPILNYWLDIGKHDDFLKAQEDIKHLNI